MLFRPAAAPNWAGVSVLLLSITTTAGTSPESWNFCCHSRASVRVREGQDRRQVQLRMTDKAYRDGSAMFLPLARHMDRAMGSFTPEELKTAARFMDAMIAATVQASQEASAAP